jgi:hypothetical protein
MAIIKETSAQTTATGPRKVSKFVNIHLLNKSGEPISQIGAILVFEGEKPTKYMQALLDLAQEEPNRISEIRCGISIRDNKPDDGKVDLMNELGLI